MFDGMSFEGLPLFERGWCMQEVELACRILHFCRDEVYYKCRTSGTCECDHVNNVKTRGLKTLTTTSALSNTKNTEPNISTTSFSKEWSKIAYKFTSLQLKYVEDTLPALSGLAQYAQCMKPGAYLARIWEKGVAYQLGWYLDEHTTSATPRKATRLTRQTFSWVTAAGPVKYSSIGEDPKGLCVLSGHQCTLASSDPFGRVEAACITLEGRAVSGSDFLFGYLEFEWYAIKELHTDNGQHFWGRDEVEGFASVLDWSNVIYFGLHTTKNAIVEGMIGLLLERSPAEEVFHRVGLALQSVCGFPGSKKMPCPIP